MKKRTHKENYSARPVRTERKASLRRWYGFARWCRTKPLKVILRAEPVRGILLSGCKHPVVVSATDLRGKVLSFRVGSKLSLQLWKELLAPLRTYPFIAYLEKEETPGLLDYLLGQTKCFPMVGCTPEEPMVWRLDGRPSRTCDQPADGTRDKEHSVLI